LLRTGRNRLFDRTAGTTLFQLGLRLTLAISQ
jgi:hypothetical protein